MQPVLPGDQIENAGLRLVHHPGAEAVGMLALPQMRDRTHETVKRKAKKTRTLSTNDRQRRMTASTSCTTAARGDASRCVRS